MAAFRGGRDAAVASSMPCVVVVDNGNNQKQQSYPAEERAVELAETIHRDNSNGKMEKKDRRGVGSGVGIGVGDDDDAPSFAVG
jgi:hypothetical protein